MEKSTPENKRKQGESVDNEYGGELDEGDDDGRDTIHSHLIEEVLDDESESLVGLRKSPDNNSITNSVKTTVVHTPQLSQENYYPY